MASSWKACFRDERRALRFLSDYAKRKVRSALRGDRRISRLDAGRLRFLHSHFCLCADRERVWHLNSALIALTITASLATAVDRCDSLWSAGGPLRPAHSADRQYSVLLVDRSAFRPSAKLHSVPGAAPALRHRHGRRMGRRRVAGDGIGSGEVARIYFRGCCRKATRSDSAGGGCVPVCLSALGLAANVFRRRLAGAAHAFHSRQGERDRSLESNRADRLGDLSSRRSSQIGSASPIWSC